VWPFEVSKAATALAELLQTHPPQPHAGIAAWEALMLTYARAHTRARAEGRGPPHVDEDLHPDDGYWITRRKLHISPYLPISPNNGYWITRRKLHGVRPWAGAGGLGASNGRDWLAKRGDHYFHSSFTDLVLGGVAGLRAGAEFVEVRPLTTLRHWAVTGARVKGFALDVVWDADGSRYGLGAGLHLWADHAHLLSTPPVTVDAGTPSGGVRGREADMRAVPARVRVGRRASGGGATGQRAVVCSAAMPPEEAPSGGGRWWVC